MATKMTDKLFRAVKIMIAGGATSTEISEYFNISLSSISRVRQAESFQEYRVMQAATYGKRKPAKTQDAPKQSEQLNPAAQQNPMEQQNSAAQQPPLALQNSAQQQNPSTQKPVTFHQLPLTPQNPLVQQPAPAPQPQVVEHRQTVTIQATHYMMQEMKRTNELLELISRKMAYIVDQLS